MCQNLNVKLQFIDHENVAKHFSSLKMAVLSMKQNKPFSAAFIEACEVVLQYSTRVQTRLYSLFTRYVMSFVIVCFTFIYKRASCVTWRLKNCQLCLPKKTQMSTKMSFDQRTILSQWHFTQRFISLLCLYTFWYLLFVSLRTDLFSVQMDV